jgi:hypothetical protein
MSYVYLVLLIGVDLFRRVHEIRDCHPRCRMASRGGQLELEGLYVKGIVPVERVRCVRYGIANGNRGRKFAGWKGDEGTRQIRVQTYSSKGGGI